MNHLVFSPELSYVIGVRYGDASPYVYLLNQNYILELRATDYDFLEEFNRCISLALGKSELYAIYEVRGRDPHYKRMWGVTGYSKRLIELLDDGWEGVVEKYPCPFIRGLGDSEGSTVCHTSKAALLLVREVRLKAILQKLDPRATRVALKYALLVDDFLSVQHGLSTEEENQLTMLARKLLNETPQVAQVRRKGR